MHASKNVQETVPMDVTGAQELAVNALMDSMVHLVASCVQRNPHAMLPNVMSMGMAYVAMAAIVDIMDSNVKYTETWSSWLQIVMNTTISRRNDSNGFKSTFRNDLDNAMPNFGPDEPDNVVFTRIDESQASSVEDVSKYLKNLKDDFKIGCEGYPDECVVCGDQHGWTEIPSLLISSPNFLKHFPG